MKINNLKLAIFAGHGGVDPGASSTYGKESEKALELMLEATKYAKSLGITVLNNRTANTARNISADAKKANNAKVDAVIEIHFDSATATANGTTGFYAEGSTSSKSLAQKVNDRVDDYFRDRDIKPDTSTRHGRLGILRETSAPAMLLETCFISNKDDMTTYGEKKTLIAQAIINGALDFFGISLPQRAPAAKGKQWLYAKRNLGIRSVAGVWDSKQAFILPQHAAIQVDHDNLKNGWFEINYQGKKGYYSASIPNYFDTKNPNATYICQDDLLFRADPRWGGPASFRRKKGQTINVVDKKNGWLKCTLGTEYGYLPDSTVYLKKK
ncbi:N-acetylmuramoyl-L-alanine amidase [Listeria booriae]|uniref:N-acetylmuramoyl-L-alanine amidase n=1 Tax=Listeria booriae TaxID=1552123 RepID=UPI001628F952|nr:N-acetylmuramoyl-L-alanine amidase [Listeria booriae]MBC1651329.1 N-acetylmuramoyl-L-alanine amidase [Listeria booriae]